MLNHVIENGSVRSVGWSPDGNSVASGSSDKTIKVWNAKTGQCVSTLTGHSGWYDFFLDNPIPIFLRILFFVDGERTLRTVRFFPPQF